MHVSDGLTARKLGPVFAKVLEKKYAAPEGESGLIDAVIFLSGFCRSKTNEKRKNTPLSHPRSSLRKWTLLLNLVPELLLGYIAIDSG